MYKNWRDKNSTGILQLVPMVNHEELALPPVRKVAHAANNAEGVGMKLYLGGSLWAVYMPDDRGSMQHIEC